MFIKVFTKDFKIIQQKEVKSRTRTLFLLQKLCV